jgi:putative spermidine/putrescine transport system substrate-binding protein
MALIPNAKNLDPGWVTPKEVFTSTGATVVAWNTKAFPTDKGPASWKDFWDVKTFPGPRGLYKPSTTTTRRRCSPPARPAPRSIRSRKTR